MGAHDGERERGSARPLGTWRPNTIRVIMGTQAAWRQQTRVALASPAFALAVASPALQVRASLVRPARTAPQALHAARQPLCRLGRRRVPRSHPAQGGGAARCGAATGRRAAPGGGARQPHAPGRAGRHGAGGQAAQGGGLARHGRRRRRQGPGHVRLVLCECWLPGVGGGVGSRGTWNPRPMPAQD